MFHSAAREPFRQVPGKEGGDYVLYLPFKERYERKFKVRPRGGLIFERFS